jgi:hypothetical protein
MRLLHMKVDGTKGFIVSALNRKDLTFFKGFPAEHTVVGEWQD